MYGVKSRWRLVETCHPASPVLPAAKHVAAVQHPHTTGLTKLAKLASCQQKGIKLEGSIEPMSTLSLVALQTFWRTH